jgi:hypothetical protein
MPKRPFGWRKPRRLGGHIEQIVEGGLFEIAGIPHQNVFESGFVSLEGLAAAIVAKVIREFRHCVEDALGAAPDPGNVRPGPGFHQCQHLIHGRSLSGVKIVDGRGFLANLGRGHDLNQSHPDLGRAESALSFLT